jgi:hypothetical protein
MSYVIFVVGLCIVLLNPAIKIIKTLPLNMFNLKIYYSHEV